MTIVRVRNHKLSLWQSAVAEVARRSQAEASGAEPDTQEILDHPMVRATNDFVRDREHKADRPLLAAEPGDPHLRKVHLSEHAFEVADARAEGRLGDADALATAWPYSDADTRFLTECPRVYAEYLARHGGRFVYRDWKTDGKGARDYGVIGWKLPNDARVGVIGDWGTGMDDAVALLRELMVRHRPHAIIHLGDIYYSGTPEECKAAFADVFTRVFDEQLGKGKRIPVFTIPGNHDYYALGYGFYPMLDALNAGVAGARQAASYFCLRTEDGGWQFLAMDTGYQDANPANQVNPAYAGPWLQPNEIAWHRDKLDRFDGATILLSHHQLFSANAKINGMASSQSEFPYLNAFLMYAFQPYFRDRIAAWLWGHEHNFVLFRNGLFGLEKGRLLGASAFEEQVSEQPYDVKYAAVKYLDPVKYRVSQNEQGYFSHSYGVIDFGVRTKPADPVKVDYYEYPAWYPKPPKHPKSTLIYSETYAVPAPTPQRAVAYGAPIHMSIEGGLTYVAALSGTAQFYPTVGTKPAKLKILHAAGQSGQIHSGALVLVQTTEAAAGAYNQLGAWATHWLYYYKPGYPKQQWRIVKLDRRKDDVIRYGDAVWLVSESYKPQTMAPTNDAYFTTTTADPPTLFTLAPAG